MSKYTLPDFNTTTGVDGALSDVTTSVPVFVPFLLLFIFSIVFVTGYRKQLVTEGKADTPVWLTIAGIVTSTTALILSTGDNLINLPTLIIPIVITIFSGIWLFSSRDR